MIEADAVIGQKKAYYCAAWLPLRYGHEWITFHLLTL